MKTKTIEHQYVLDQLQQIAHGLGETFAPFCEVVVHDLTKPDHAILAIHNNLSGREIGDPMTELGPEATADPPIQTSHWYHPAYPTSSARCNALGFIHHTAPICQNRTSHLSARLSKQSTHKTGRAF